MESRNIYFKESIQYKIKYHYYKILNRIKQKIIFNNYIFCKDKIYIFNTILEKLKILF